MIAIYLKQTSAYKKNVVVELGDTMFGKLSARGVVREATEEEIAQAKSSGGSIEQKKSVSKTTKDDVVVAKKGGNKKTSEGEET